MRGKAGIFVLAALLFASAFVGVANVRADVSGSAGGVTWTIQWADANMIDHSELSPADEPIVINEDTSGHFIYAGEVGATLSFDVDVSAATGADTTCTIISNTANIEVDGTDDGETWVVGGAVDPADAAGVYTVDFIVNVSNDINVEQAYLMTARFQWGTNQVDIQFSIYVSSIARNAGSIEEKPVRPELHPTTAGNFLPMMNNENSYLRVPNNCPSSLQTPATVTVTSPPAGFTFHNTEATIDPGTWASGDNGDFYFWVDVDSGVAPGNYQGSMTLTYEGYYGSAWVPITEHLNFQLNVDFAPYVECTYTPPTVSQDDDTVTFDLTFSNEGNVDLYDLYIFYQDDPNDVLEFMGFQYEEGPAGSSYVGTWDYVHVDVLSIGDTVQAQLTLKFSATPGYGTHYIPFEYAGYYYDDGSLGGDTGYTDFDVYWNTSSGNGVTERDPFYDLDAYIGMGTPYDYGAWASFNVGLVPDFSANVVTHAIYLGGQTEDIALEIRITDNETEAPLGLSDVQATLRGGEDTPFVGDVAGELPLEAQNEVWYNTDSYDVTFYVDLDPNATEGTWMVPLDITCTNVVDGTELSTRLWVPIDIVDPTFTINPTGPTTFYQEEQTIDIQVGYQLRHTLGITLDDARATLQVGPGTPFYDAEDHSRTALTFDVGDMNSATNYNVEYDVDLNTDIPPGTYSLNFTLVGYAHDSGQMVVVHALDTSDAVIRILPEPADLAIGDMEILDPVVPGQTFRVQLNITNMGGQTAHDVDVMIWPNEWWDDWMTLEDFMYAMTPPVKDLNGQTYLSTSPYYQYWYSNSWSNNSLSLDNNSGLDLPGEYYTPINVTLEALGVDSVEQIYALDLFIHGAYSSPYPQQYLVHADTIGPGETLSLIFVFNADKDMVPGMVYGDIEVDISWYDEEDNHDGAYNVISLKTSDSGTPYMEGGFAAGGGEETTGVSGVTNGLLALIAFLVVLILILLFIGLRQITAPEEEEEDWGEAFQPSMEPPQKGYPQNFEQMMYEQSEPMPMEEPGKPEETPQETPADLPPPEEEKPETPGDSDEF